jgi:sulfur-oxidizing protein SoxZ
MFPAIAANPFLSFSVVAEKSGTLTMTFTDDDGVTQSETATVTVT